MNIASLTFPIIYKESKIAWSIGAYQTKDEFLKASQGDANFYKDLTIFSVNGVQYIVTTVKRLSRKLLLPSFTFTGLVDLDVKKIGQFTTNELRDVIKDGVLNYPDYWDADGNMYDTIQRLDSADDIEALILVLLKKEL